MELPPHEVYMHKKDAKAFLGFSPRKWERYVKQGFITKYYKPYSNRATYKRAELECLIHFHDYIMQLVRGT